MPKFNMNWVYLIAIAALAFFFFTNGSTEIQGEKEATTGQASYSEFKNFVKAEKQGRSSAYTPLVSREEYLASQSRRFFDKLCKGSVSDFATALADSGISREDLAELRRLLEEGEL